jgi:hypothetical protein
MALPETTIDNKQYEAALANLPRTSPAALAPARLRGLVWLALAPAWPETLAMNGFPTEDGEGFGQRVAEFLSSLVEDGLALSGPGEPPLEGRWYWMDDLQRRTTISAVLANPSQGLPFLGEELRYSCKAMAAALGNTSPNPAFARWLELAGAEKTDAMADVVNRRVAEAIKASQGAEAVYSAEASGWTEAARPLADIFGGALEVALARAQRRLEVFRRNARDLRSLKNYYPRQEQEDAFEALIGPRSENSWALHYIGMGGIGKTMLVRRIRTALAKDRLAVGHVDFDHLNPDYPRRAPGLLLQSLAEDLRLNDDPYVTKVFADFDREIRVVHQRLQGQFLIGDAQDTAAREGLGHAVLYFAEALKLILKQGLRPLLLLDTCEELARMRVDGTIPENLRFTFDLVEQIHDALPELRVVYSGRRPLSGEGLDWKWPGCPLKTREYLRLFPITPFSESEAKGFLEAYKRDGRAVPPGLEAEILQQSKVETLRGAAVNRISPIQWANPSVHPAVSEDEGYYPYDLDLFASWASSPKGLDIEKLRAAGAHYYVKDRIVDPIGPVLRPWLADLVLLGRFDQRMIQELTRLSDRLIGNFWKAIVDEEWTEIDRTAQTEEVWAVEPHLRDRMLAYYRDEDAASLGIATARVATLLPRITLERPFAELSPAYFDACLKVLSTTPADATAWWSGVEARIAREGRWDWANDITSQLAESDPASPFRAAILALQCAAQLHLSGIRMYNTWAEVLGTCDAYPDPVVSARLKFRARNGTLPGPAERKDSPEETAMLAFSCIEVLDTSLLDPQLSATAIATLEYAVERLETVPRDKVGDILERLAAKAALVVTTASPRVLVCFAHSLLARLKGSLSMMIQAQSIVPAEAASREQCWFDWLVPDNLRDRLALQGALLGQAAPPVVFGTIDNVDSDRLFSLTLTTALRRVLPAATGADPAVKEIPPEFTPVCNAHRALPPSIAPRIEWMAAQGAVDDAVRVAARILTDTRTPAATRQAVQDHFLRVVLRFRLYEEKIGLDLGTTNTRDAQLSYFLRAGVVGTVEEAAERSKFIHELVDEAVPDAEPRRAGANFLFAAMMQSSNDPAKALEFYREARKRFNLAMDPLSENMCAIGEAGCLTATGDLDAGRQVLEMRSSNAPWRLPAADVTPWGDFLDSYPRAMRPWLLRLAACNARYMKSSDPASYDSLRQWIAKTYASSLPPDLAAILAPSANPFVAFALLFARLKPVLKQSGYGLLGLAFFALISEGLYKLWIWILSLFHVHLPGWEATLALITLLVFLGFVPAMARGYIAFIAHAFRARLRIKCSVEPVSELDPLTVPCEIEGSLYFASSWRFRRTSFKTMPVSFDQPYAVQSARSLANARLNLPIEYIIEIEKAAAAPWEAIFALNGGKTESYDKGNSRYRRMLADKEQPMLPPIPATGRAVTWRLETDRQSAQVWETAMGGRMAHTIEEPETVGSLRRDDSIAVLHIMGRPVETPTGLGIGLLKSNTESMLLPQSIQMVAPLVRVCIVQDFQADAHPRTPSDRYAANIARLLGYQIHAQGVPVVIMIPSLPEAQAAEVLQNIATAVGRFPALAGPALTKAVEASRRKISRDAKPDTMSATELACDLILYCGFNVELSLAKK